MGWQCQGQVSRGRRQPWARPHSCGHGHWSGKGLQPMEPHPQPHSQTHRPSAPIWPGLPTLFQAEPPGSNCHPPIHPLPPPSQGKEKCSTALTLQVSIQTLPRQTGIVFLQTGAVWGCIGLRAWGRLLDFRMTLFSNLWMPQMGK
jgi:hypothetical protein